MKSMILALWVLVGLLFHATPAQAQNPTQFCFGAGGMQCGQFRNGELQGVAFCGYLTGTSIFICEIHGGSLTHDPCCYANPNGKVCGASPETNRCSVEWDRSVSRFVWRYGWYRVVDPARGNSTGRVETNLYHANRGAGVHRNDRRYCRSGSSRRAEWWERIGRPDLFICN